MTHARIITVPRGITEGGYSIVGQLVSELVRLYIASQHTLNQLSIQRYTTPTVCVSADVRNPKQLPRKATYHPQPERQRQAAILGHTTEYHGGKASQPVHGLRRRRRVGAVHRTKATEQNTVPRTAALDPCTCEHAQTATFNELFGCLLYCFTAHAKSG